MQKPTSDKIKIGQTLNPATDYGGFSSINDEGTLENIVSKVDKSTNFIKTGQADEDLSRLLPKYLTYNQAISDSGRITKKGICEQNI